MPRTNRQKSKSKKSSRRTRRKIRGEISISKTLAIALGLISGSKGHYGAMNDEKLTLLDGREFTVKSGFYNDGIYMRKRDIPRPPQEDNNGLVVRPTDNSLQLSNKMEIFEPVTITGTKLEEEYAKWVWVKKDILCQVADSLTSPWKPGENLLKCETKSKYLALEPANK